MAHDKCRQWVARALAGITATVFAAPGLASASAPSQILLVSIDGLSWSRLSADRAHLPVLNALMSRGSAGPLTTVFPSMTWAAHAAIASGSLPAKSGVLGNRFYDRAKDDVVETWERDYTLNQMPTLWQVAARAGWSAGALLWPQTSRDRALSWNVPEVYGASAFAVGSSPGLLAAVERHLGIPAPHMARLGREEAFLLDSWSRTVATWLVTKEKPRLLLLHFLAVDTYAHAYGPDAPEPGWALENVDHYLGQVLAAYDRAGLGASTAVCIVSDHGFLAYAKAFGPVAELRRAGLSANESKLLRVAVNGQAIFVYGRGRASAAEEVPQARGKPKPRPVDKALDKARRWLSSRKDYVEQLIEPTEYPARGLGDPSLNPHLPDFIALLLPDVQGVMGSKPAATGSVGGGGHGYLPDHPSLQGVFILAGPGARTRPAPVQVRAIDVAPTLALMAGWKWPVPTDGAALSELLAP